MQLCKAEEKGKERGEAREEIEIAVVVGDYGERARYCASRG